MSVRAPQTPHRPARGGWPLGASLAIATITLLVLPFFSTFGELLTNVAIATGLDAWVGQWIAPIEAHAARGALALLGLHAAAEGPMLFVGDAARGAALYISWNCVGWQTLLFLAVSLVPGLHGDYTRRSRVETALLGVAGIALLNVMRITAVALVALAFGQLPAIIAHDYGSVLATVVFLMAFWVFAYNVTLERASDLEAAS